MKGGGFGLIETEGYLHLIDRFFFTTQNCILIIQIIGVLEYYVSQH